MKCIQTCRRHKSDMIFLSFYPWLSALPLCGLLLRLSRRQNLFIFRFKQAVKAEESILFLLIAFTAFRDSRSLSVMYYEDNPDNIEILINAKIPFLTLILCSNFNLSLFVAQIINLTPPFRALTYAGFHLVRSFLHYFPQIALWPPSCFNSFSEPPYFFFLFVSFSFYALLIYISFPISRLCFISAQFLLSTLETSLVVDFLCRVIVKQIWIIYS